MPTIQERDQLRVIGNEYAKFDRSTSNLYSDQILKEALEELTYYVVKINGVQLKLELDVQTTRSFCLTL